MAAPSRLERLVNLLGEANLPLKIPQIQITEQNNDDCEVTPKAEKKVNWPSAEETSQEDEWWNATPQIPQPIREQKPPDAPVLTVNGDMTFPFDPRNGEAAPRGISFSPLLGIAKFPYKFVQKNSMQSVASAFFDQGKIWAREWDVYYIWSDYFETAKPVTFVPEHQLLALIEEIQEALPAAKVTLSDWHREQGLILNFDDIDRVDLRPRWLGRSTSKAQHDWWVENLPLPAQVTGNMATKNADLEAFKEKMELATEIAKNKSKANRAKKQAENVVKRQGMVKSLLRAQRYLGLLTKTDDSLFPDITNLSISPLDGNLPAPHPFDEDVIFIAFDVEAYERPPRMVTEIGVATLDTRDLRDSKQAPGNAGEDWQQFIRARHFRIAEYKTFVNKDFVDGCPANFEFGQSEFIGKDSVGTEIAKCFKPPYNSSGKAASEEKRNIVLLGHDVMQDINYLQKIGVNVVNSGGIIDKFDTAEMYRVQTRDPNPKSLGSIIYDFDLVAWHLHNAGNDAVYTIWAMLAICVQAASERGSSESEQKHVETMVKRTEEAVERAKERVKDESEGWDSEVGDDGGVAVPPAEAVVYGPPRPHEHRLYTIGGAPLDV